MNFVLKSLAFVVGAVLGYALLGLARPAPAPQAMQPAGTVNPSQILPVAKAAEADPAVEVPASLTPAVAFARSRPRAFIFSFAYNGAPATRGLSAEDIADPQFAELYHQAVRTRAISEFAPYVALLQLTPQQFDMLVAVGIDQALAYQALPDTIADRQLRLKQMDDLSFQAQARLGGVLAPEQMEYLTGLSPGVRGYAAMLDNFAARNLPFSPDQVRQMWTSQTLHTRSGDYLQHVIRIEEAAPWLTPEQRRLLTNQRRWAQAAGLKASLSAASVRDPEVRDLWPQ